ncbi:MULTISPECIES: hypothetical protein [Bacillus]|uniref:Uncharacterized protein n=1 Tax=Bacillus thuringiensis YBT-1518 TaxID=529122 RepID=A0A9W3PHH6_BACTU|nr:hypothetical protein [Bacillus thuringiensis]EKS8362628.1 hypothetical protein [Bacillus cereus]AHA73480.1 hypothetical protein YBT1518_21770 [Bacillus thuringiensis YBT-1518]EKS8370136.1 hypothetical protein [Bacillus cereus]MBG9484582.1 hypothetical protein [Bacillus thuringiensis]MBG9497161.1 hypothetical protein [Bacillus thuringiensis]
MNCYIKDPGGAGGSPLFDPGNGGAGLKIEPGGHRMNVPSSKGLKNNTDPGGW